MNWKIVFIIIVFSVLTGCSSKENFIILSATEDGDTGAIRIETDKGETILDQADTAVFVEDRESVPSAPTPMSEPEANAIFADALKVHPLMPESFILYFGLDSDALTPESNSEIARIIDAIQKRHSSDISIIGHTDRTGEDAYNRKLSLERAKTVINLLVERNVDEANMTIFYHGEGNPLVPTADNIAEPRNRRVEVVVR